MRRVIALAAVLLLVPGCAGEPAADAQVVLTEMAIAAPAAAAAGAQVWQVRNTGETHHNLTVCAGQPGRCDGPHLDQRVLRKDPSARDPESLPDVTDALVLGSGWTNLIEVELEPGTYRLWCAVPNHAAKGMETMLAVR